MRDPRLGATSHGSGSITTVEALSRFARRGLGEINAASGDDERIRIGERHGIRFVPG